MRLIISSILLLSIFSSCKPTGDDLSGSEEIAGKIYLLNPYDSFPPLLLASQTILLQRGTDVTPASYLFNTVSDDKGAFKFSFLYKDSTYKIHAEKLWDTRVDEAVLFTIDSTLKPSKNLVITMKPDTVKQNGLYIICIDTVTNPKPGLVPRDSIYIYTSGMLAIADSAAIIGQGASYRFVASVEGKALKMNLPYDAPIYINTACTYGGKRYRSKYDNITLRKTGIDTLIVKLIPNP